MAASRQGNVAIAERDFQDERKSSVWIRDIHTVEEVLPAEEQYAHRRPAILVSGQARAVT
jgi:hypothetical protein